MLDPNTATKEQLVAVPGMTAAAADALIAGRPYRDMVAVDKALASLTRRCAQDRLREGVEADRSQHGEG